MLNTVSRTSISTLIAIAATLLAATPWLARAQAGYPSKPIRLVIPAGAGGITDILGRHIAQRISEPLGQQVVVDNRTGANGVLGTHIVASATPDGHTLLMVYPAHPVNPSLIAKLPYDTINAFSPITQVSAVSMVLLVNAALPVKTVKDLIALARDKPGQIHYGAVGAGSLGHLGGEMFRARTGAQIVHVAYKGAPQVFSALAGGEIGIYFAATMGSAMPLIQSGRVRALGVTAPQRVPAMPDIPAIIESVPGFEVQGWNGILAPAGTPRPIIDRLNREIVRVVRTPEFAARLTTEGAVAVGNTPEQFDAVIRADIAKWAKVVKDAGIRAN